MLRKIRIAFALVFFISITMLFLDYTGSIHTYLGWMAKIQFLPALFAVNMGVVVGLLLLTLLFGRIYCSVICPLGIFQDIVSFFSGKRKSHKNHFAYTKEKKILRYAVLVLFVVAFVAGLSSFVALLAPYSSFGRIVSNIFSPLYLMGNNLLASLASHMDSYRFYETDVWLKSIPTLVIALVSFFVIGILAWFGGRTYCNTICPVGTILGSLSRYSIFHPVIDKTKCKKCGKCAKKCKASCIDSKEGKIDYSRCVDCFDCLENCHFGAISFARKSKQKVNKEKGIERLNTSEMTKSTKENTPDETISKSRRHFLSVAMLMTAATAVKADEKIFDGGFADIKEKKEPNRATPIVPAGAFGLRHFSRHCSACGLCISVCPNQVLRPTNRLLKQMQPEVSYERGYCRPECTKCSEVCPTGAIKRIDKAKKSSIQIGHAVWIKENCIPLKDGVSCNSCETHCPVQAITMVSSDPEYSNSVKIPVIDAERCIGCGACENLCPSRPFSAIYVEGHEQHKFI